MAGNSFLKGRESTMRNLKKIIPAFGLTALIALSGCGEAAEAPPTAGAEPEGLVLAADEAWARSAAEEYAAENPGVKIEIISCRTATELVSALGRGEAVDMYLVQLDDPFTGDVTEEMWGLSADLKARFAELGTELVGGLEGAMEYGGELRLLPLDFTLYTFISPLGEMPASLPEAEALAEGAGTPLFAPYRDRENLTAWLLPYLIDSVSSGDTAQYRELARLLENHEGELAPAEEGECLFDMRFLNASASFALPAYAEGCVFGIPGSDARAFYSPNLVFGIVSGSEKADAAWDFLKTFYDGYSPDGDAGAFPAVKAEFDRLIGERLGEGAPPEAAAAAAALAYEADAAAPGMSQGETLRESAELQALISAGE